MNIESVSLDHFVVISRRVKHLHAENNRLTTQYFRLLFAAQDFLTNAKHENDSEGIKKYLEFFEQQIKSIEDVRNNAKKKHDTARIAKPPNPNPGVNR